MTSAAWQFVAATVLLAAWAWVLGKPVLTNWSRRRRNDRFDYRRAEGGPETRWSRRWRGRPRPVMTWRAQPLFARRLQFMLALALSSVFSLFLAIAFGGQFVRLFITMIASLGISLVVAVIVGTVQLRQAEWDRDLDLAWQVHGSKPVSGDVGVAPLEADDLGLASYLAGQEAGWRSDGLEPLVFEPLDFDDVFDGMRVAAAYDELRTLSAGIEDEDEDEPVENDEDEPVEIDDGDIGVDDAGVDDAEDEGQGPVFTAAPEAGAKQASARARRSKRRKARPIHIESSLDEHDDQRTSGNR